MGTISVILILSVVTTIGLALPNSAFAGAPPPPEASVSINDVSMEEGDEGTTIFSFTVTATNVFEDSLVVAYETSEDSAIENDDYVGESGNVILLQDVPPGTAVGTITIEVNGDTDFEFDETFFVNILNCGVGAYSCTDSQGEGIIENDDVISSPDDVFVVMGTCCNDDPDDGSLASADLETGDLTQIGDSIANEVERDGLSGLAIDSDGRFFVTAVTEGASSILLEINGNTGEIINNLGPTTREAEFETSDVRLRDLSFQPGTDILFGVGRDVTVIEGFVNNGLFTVDTSDGSLELISAIEGSTIQGLAFAPDGTLYGTNNNCEIVTLLDDVDHPEEQNTVTDLFNCYDGLGIDSAGQIFGTTSEDDSLHLIFLEDGSDVLVAGAGTNPSDVDFISGSPFTPTLSEPGNGEIHRGDPTLGVQRNGILVQSDGFCFDLFCLDVFDYFNHLPIQQVNSGSTHTISLTAFCPSGANRCNYASVGAAPPGTDINSVEWNLMLKRIGLTDNWELIENDPNNMLGDVVGTVQVIDASRIQYSFSIQFTTPASIGTVDGNAQPPVDNMILVTEIRDSNGGSNRNIFNDGVFVNDIYAYPQIDEAFMPPLEVESLCLNEDSTKRYTCAFDKVRQWTIKQAEQQLEEIYNDHNNQIE